jgi:hypothetical protein
VVKINSIIDKDSEKSPAQYYDTAWKTALQFCGHFVVSFLLPNIVDKLVLSECSKGQNDYNVPLSLSSEGRRIADFCYVVPFNSDNNSIYKNIVLVIEQQHKNDKNLPLRLFQLSQRAKLVYPESRVITFALLTGKKQDGIQSGSNDTIREYIGEKYYTQDIFYSPCYSVFFLLQNRNY